MSLDAGWWWIWDDARLSTYEKAVAMAIYRCQYRGNPVLRSRKQICELASMGRTKLISCEKSLQGYGVLRMEPTGRKEVFLYQVICTQANLFHRKSATIVENPVQNAVGTIATMARPEGSGDSDRPQYEQLLGGDRPYHGHVVTAVHHTNTNSKPGARVCAAAHPDLPVEKQKTARERIEEHFDYRKEQEDRRRIEARDRRLGMVAASVVGSVPAARMTDAQIDARQRQLREQADRIMQRAAV